MPEKVYVATRSSIGSDGKAYNEGEKVVNVDRAELSRLLADGSILPEDLQEAAHAGTGDQRGVGGEGISRL